MKALLLLFLSVTAQASWHYNENAGFGIYQPEGWRISSEGRSSTLFGPSGDRAQSKIFLGSDWMSGVDSLAALENYVRRETGDKQPRAVTVSDLPGFEAGTSLKGAIYLLRVKENVIVIEYNLRGSRDQIDEGETALGSIEVRTKGIEYP